MGCEVGLRVGSRDETGPGLLGQRVGKTSGIASSFLEGVAKELKGCIRVEGKLLSSKTLPKQIVRKGFKVKKRDSLSTSLRWLNLLPPAIIPIIISSILLILKHLKTKPSGNTNVPLPPGPYPLPFVGCIIQMLLNKPTSKWIHNLMDQYNTPILCIKLGSSTHVIAVSSTNIACEFLKTQDLVFASRPEALSSHLMSNGYRATIVSPFGDQWKKMRKILKHDILAAPILKWLRPKRDEEANHLVRYLYKLSEDGGLVNIRMVGQHFCGNLMRNMVFGTRLFGEGMANGGPGEEEIKHIEAVYVILRYLFAFSITDFIPWLRGKTDFDGHEKMMRDALKVVRGYHDPLIDERIKMWKDGIRTEKDDVLDIFIKHENPKLTTEEIKAQIIELMLAGIDNPSNATEWVMAEMMNEPEILKKAVEELDQVVGRNRLVEEQDLPRLNYIKACIKEAFRLHPFASFNAPHVSVEDTTVAGYFIPEGSHVFLSRRGLGRNPDVWNDPTRFDPERHLEGNEEVVLYDDELRMISFSTGRRGCPGIVLGSTISTMLLARMVQGFTWEMPNNEPISLVEHHEELCLAKPLVVVAKPRLSHHLYPKI
ncbi:tryptophan N-monooxygenase 1-like [Rutidosis leptorrhynchoides]|uniref:tryptophan N-monooxygenase 1-like n=1 Tax=Rutidosis leptorrhynchoides TaxID=125765 RepID=UPI003A9960A6